MGRTAVSRTALHCTELLLHRTAPHRPHRPHSTKAVTILQHNNVTQLRLLAQLAASQHSDTLSRQPRFVVRRMDTADPDRRIECMRTDRHTVEANTEPAGWLISQHVTRTRLQQLSASPVCLPACPLACLPACRPHTATSSAPSVDVSALPHFFPVACFLLNSLLSLE